MARATRAPPMEAGPRCRPSSTRRGRWSRSSTRRSPRAPRRESTSAGERLDKLLTDDGEVLLADACRRHARAAGRTSTCPSRTSNGRSRSVTGDGVGDVKLGTAVPSSSQQSCSHDDGRGGGRRWRGRHSRGRQWRATPRAADGDADGGGKSGDGGAPPGGPDARGDGRRRRRRAAGDGDGGWRRWGWRRQGTPAASGVERQRGLGGAGGSGDGGEGEADSGGDVPAERCTRRRPSTRRRGGASAASTWATTTSTASTAAPATVARVVCNGGGGAGDLSAWSAVAELRN